MQDCTKCHMYGSLQDCTKCHMGGSVQHCTKSCFGGTMCHLELAPEGKNNVVINRHMSGLLAFAKMKKYKEFN